MYNLMYGIQCNRCDDKKCTTYWYPYNVTVQVHLVVTFK